MSADNGTVDLTQARQHLEAGRAVILPNPAPLACVVAAINPYAVNRVMGRAPDRPVTLWAHHADTLDRLTPILALPDDAQKTLGKLLLRKKAVLSVPLRRGTRVPSWLAPAVGDGRVSLFGVRWQPLHALLGPFPLLFVSEAESSAGAPASSAAEAITMFPLAVPVLGTTGLGVARKGGGRQSRPWGRRRAHTLIMDREGQVRPGGAGA
jgi:hypothetical protein